jgi:hypothetical protein
MKDIPGFAIPRLKQQAIERLEQNIKDQSQEIERFKEVLATMEHELDLARVTLALLKQIQ